MRFESFWIFVRAAGGAGDAMLLEHLLELMLEHVLVARIGLEQKVVCFGNMFLELFWSFCFVPTPTHDPMGVLGK